MKNPFPAVMFVVGLLAVPVLGPIMGGLLLTAVIVGMIIFFRQRRRRMCAVTILRTLDRLFGGRVIAYPGVSLLMPDFLVPVDKQWQLAVGLRDDGLISLDKVPPRHVPPDVTGVVMTITPEGREWLARHQGERKPRAGATLN